MAAVRADFVVIGAGLTGLSTAWVLTRRGREVTVLDQAPIGHLGGGSHGTCRIFRLGYEHAEYVTLACRARDVWTDLEQRCGERLLHPVPQLTFGPQMPQVHEAMRRAGAPCELLSAAAAARRFPAVRPDGDVLLEPDSAVIDAERALASLTASVTASGLAAVTAGQAGQVIALADDGQRVTVRTGGGDIQAGRVIACAGPWSARLLATAGITVPGAATLEQVVFLAPAPGRAAGDGESPVPIFVHYGGEFPYGLPEPGTGRYKIGLHHGGPAVDPDHQDQAEDAGLTARIERAARRFLPGFDPHPVATQRCVYDNSPDTDFVVDRVGNIVIGCGTSGHGFKFGPLLGQWLAALAAGPEGAEAEPVPPRFAVRRFA